MMTAFTTNTHQDDMGQDGWKNDETWTANLWLNNDEGTRQRWESKTRAFAATL